MSPLSPLHSASAKLAESMMIWWHLVFNTSLLYATMSKAVVQASRCVIAAQVDKQVKMNSLYMVRMM
jgi:hypothetical protein